jgi:gamma-glutamyl:cysteine ligase YbdK (ATP-grasp superfamily)
MNQYRFDRHGVELEYMIVNKSSLEVTPLADRLLKLPEGGYGDRQHEEITWSNELCLHLIELKTTQPIEKLESSLDAFNKHVTIINQKLDLLGCCLLPGGMHPWMNPASQTQLWPHGSREIYHTFDRIFGCHGHGWSNLQSTHLNLPFGDEASFLQLHRAIRVLLPILPALAASSPFVEGTPSRFMDERIKQYQSNCALIPTITGRVVPESIRSIRDYERHILNRIARQLKHHDPSGVLEPEWTNARGAIARFSRQSIEIRVMDNQECPQADLAILQVMGLVLSNLIDRESGFREPVKHPSTRILQSILGHCVKDGTQAHITHKPYLEALGLEQPTPMKAGELWRALIEQVGWEHLSWVDTIELILNQGCLAERLKKVAGDHPDLRQLRQVYQQLAHSLASGKPFVA